MRKLVLIDFSWLYNKYYYVALQNVSLNIEQSSKGAEGLKEVLEQMLFQFLGHVEKSYSKVYLVLDSELSSTKNKEIFEGYKGNRDKEAKKEVYRFISEIIKDLAHKLNPKVFYFIREKLHEADELLAYLAKKFYEKFEIIIFSGDKDLLQLTSFPNVFISDKFEKGKFIIKTDDEIFLKFKNSRGEDFSRISTNKRDILKYRSLKGDNSDNLSAVFPRIKDKEIVEIIKNYWLDDQEEPLTEVRIEKILEDLEGDNSELANKLRESKEVWLRNYKIMDLLHVEDINVRRLV